MTKTDLTESSFGFAYTFELTTLWKNRLIAPYIPSLIEEGRRGGGYDVALNTRRLDRAAAEGKQLLSGLLTVRESSLSRKRMKKSISWTYLQRS